MRFKAFVKAKKGQTTPSVGILDQEDNDELSRTVKWIEIVQEQDGIYLYHYSEDGICVADSWHLSVEEAKSQAAYEFGTQESEWKEIRVE